MNRWINCRMKWNYHLPDGKKGANVVLVDKFQALAVIPLSLVETRVRERERARISLEFLRCPRRYNPLVRRKLSLTTSCSFARSPPPPPSYLLFIARQVIESAYFQKQRLFRSGVRQQREEQGKKEQLVFLVLISVLVVYIRCNRYS